MSNTWRWIFGVLIGAFILGLVFVGGANRRAYRAARGAVEQRVEISQDRIDAVADLGITAVEKALELAGELPGAEAQAERIIQEIEATRDSLNDASAARGDVAIERLDATIEQFNLTLETVENAADEAESPAVKAVLDRIYGILVAVQSQIVEFINNVAR
jgi:hypothetical protein